MCELFAMASRLPASVNLSLEEFAKHGGQTGGHQDGWGIAYYDDGDALLIREPRPASRSAHMNFVRGQFGSTLVISHIRKATMGSLSLKNTQPFARELAGRVHVFAHNGMLPGIFETLGLSTRHYQPMGETDSEYAFCVLLERLAAIWIDNRSSPPLDERLAVVAEFASQIRELGPANFIYCDSEVIIAHGHKRKHSEGTRPPGLHFLCRSCEDEPTPVDVAGLNISTRYDSQDLVLLASVPLSDESWTPLKEGELLLLQGGYVVERV
ncbi:MAG: class II glutamine amidotransferase [Gemmatimonadales bacterium]